MRAIIPPPIPSTLGYRELCTLLFPRGTPPTCVPRPQASGSSSPGTDVSNSAVAADDVLHTAADHADTLPLRGSWRPKAKLPPRARNAARRPRSTYPWHRKKRTASVECVAEWQLGPRRRPDTAKPVSQPRHGRVVPMPRAAHRCQNSVLPGSRPTGVIIERQRATAAVPRRRNARSKSSSWSSRPRPPRGPQDA